MQHYIINRIFQARLRRDRYRCRDNSPVHLTSSDLTNPSGLFTMSSVQYKDFLEFYGEYRFGVISHDHIKLAAVSSSSLYISFLKFHVLYILSVL